MIFAETGAGQSFYLFNGHGDVVQLTSITGVVIKAYDYDTFGNERNLDPTDTNPFRYCGEYFDSETGTYYLRARYYAPVIGRFLTEDTYRGENADPLSLNLYVYCASNPVAFIDLSGNFPIDFQKIIGGSFTTFIGWTIVGAGTALLTVATGGTVLIAYATIAAGGVSMAYGGSEVWGGITGYNPGEALLGKDLYHTTGLLAAFTGAVGVTYASNVLQMNAQLATNTLPVYSANGDAELRATRRPAYEAIVEDGVVVNGQRFKMSQHALNSLFKSGRKDIMPADVLDALASKPMLAEAGTVQYVNSATGTTVFVNPQTNLITGIYPASFRR